jgi:hypothetical protein
LSWFAAVGHGTAALAEIKVAREKRRYSNRRINDFRKLAQLTESAAIGWYLLRSFAAAAKHPE